MTSADLASVWAKFGRAEAHINALKRDVTAWIDSKPYSLTKNISPDFTRHGWTINVANKPDLEKWSLIASDALHNLRCALDHLVYAVATFQHKVNPPPDADILAFPICDDAGKFKKARRKIRELSLPVRAEIEGMQPYNRPHVRLPPLLGLLRDFDDADKHKLLHVAMAQPWNVEVTDIDMSACRRGEYPRVVIDHGDVEDGAEIATIVFPRPSHDVKHKIMTAVVVSIEHRISPLNRTRSELADVLLELLPEVRRVIETIARVA